MPTTPQSSTPWWVNLLAALLLVSPWPSVQAATASVASVEKLVAINGAQKSLEQALAGMETQLRQQILADMIRQNANKPLSPQQLGAISQIVPKVAAILRADLSWDTLKAAYIRIYRSQLEQAEVDRLIQLYQDPAYQRILEKMQTINQQSARLMLEQMPGIMQKVQPVLEDAVRQALQP